MSKEELKIDQLVYKKMFVAGMKNMSTSSDFIIFKAVDVDNNVEKVFCCESRILISDSYLSINDFSNEEFMTVKMSHSQFVEIGAAYYDLKTVDSLFRAYPPRFIDSVYNDDLHGKNPEFLSQISNKFSYPYIEHVFLLNRIPVFRDCESGYICMRKKN